MDVSCGSGKYSQNSNENAFQNVYDDFWDIVLMSSNQYQ